MPGKTLLSGTRFAAAALAIGLALCCPYRLSHAQQNPFGQLGEALKQKAAERTVSALLNNDLPLRLDANAVYPTAPAPPRRTLRAAAAVADRGRSRPAASPRRLHLERARVLHGILRASPRRGCGLPAGPASGKGRLGHRRPVVARHAREKRAAAAASGCLLGHPIRIALRPDAQDVSIRHRQRDSRAQEPVKRRLYPVFGNTTDPAGPSDSCPVAALQLPARREHWRIQGRP